MLHLIVHADWTVTWWRADPDGSNPEAPPVRTHVVLVPMWDEDTVRVTLDAPRIYGIGASSSDSAGGG